MTSRQHAPWILVAIAVGTGGGCLSTEAPLDDLSSVQEAVGVVGDALPGTDLEEFEEARSTFSDVEGIADGLGPIFNEASCGNCHTAGALGGAGEQIERRFGRVSNNRFDPLANLGGSLRQLFTLGNFNNPNLPSGSRGRCNRDNPTLCCVPMEAEPQNATVHNVGRLTTPLFGLGLVDAMPDSFFDSLASAQPSSIRGIVNRVKVLLPDPADRNQSIGSTRVGRFGWKAGVPGLVQFSADAYVNEMGITTQSCFRGRTITNFATESAPNGVAVAPGCDDLAPPAPQTPDVPAFTDDAVGSCANSRTEIQEDVAEFAEFMTHLAPAPRDFSDRNASSRGEQTFSQVQCNGCHVSTTFRTPQRPFNGVPGSFSFNPFSDFLLHDMGALGDRIGNSGDSVASTRNMRTAPLWGIRFRNHLLHDGRSGDVAAAIREHDGQGAAARDAFNRLSSSRQHDLVQYVRSL